MLSQASFVLFGLLSSSVSALAPNGPAPTPNPQPYGLLPHHSNPQPTIPPYPHDLLRRQSAPSSSAQRTLLAAPDDTCGYLGGVSDRSWGCATGNCVFATPTPIVNSTQLAGAGSVLCCDPSTGCPSSPAPTACVDNYNNAANTVSPGSVSADPMTLTCTSGIYRFCNTLTFANPSISALFCNYISNTLIQNATTTYADQADHAFTPTVPVFAVSFTPTTAFSSSASKSSAKSSSGSATATGVPSTEGKKKVDKGAVIGGVIGGVVGLTLLIGAVVMFLRWRRSGDVHEEGEGDTETPVSEVVKPTNKA